MLPSTPAAALPKKIPKQNNPKLQRWRHCWKEGLCGNILAILSPKKRKCVSEEPEAVRSFGVHTIKDLTVPEPFACSMTFNKKLQKTKRQNDITQSTACFIIKDKISVENIVTDLWCELPGHKHCSQMALLSYTLSAGRRLNGCVRLCYHIGFVVKLHIWSRGRPHCTLHWDDTALVHFCPFRIDWSGIPLSNCQFKVLPRQHFRVSWICTAVYAAVFIYIYNIYFMQQYSLFYLSWYIYWWFFC